MMIQTTFFKVWHEQAMIARHGDNSKLELEREKKVHDMLAQQELEIAKATKNAQKAQFLAAFGKGNDKVQRKAATLRCYWAWVAAWKEARHTQTMALDKKKSMKALCASMIEKRTHKEGKALLESYFKAWHVRVREAYH